MDAGSFHIAEFNISRLKAPLESPDMKEFVDFLEPANKFAEEACPSGAASRQMDRLPPTCLPLMRMR